MASTSNASITNGCEKYKHENFPTYQSHLSSSSSSVIPDYKYDVFLSFRGEDTRNNFTDHLYTELNRNGVFTFKDDEELDRGKEVSPELLEAIRISRFSIVVLSKNYADSRWCLDELVHILECLKPGKSIIPIFYDVDPTVVRHQTGIYAKAFAEHGKKHPKDKVDKWRFGLRAVADISGWNLKDGPEAEFIRKVVQDISYKLDDTSTEMDKLKSASEEPFRLDGTEVKYDVYLSFKGEDSVMNFTNHLCTALDSSGILTFKDTDERDKAGKDISPDLVQAIQGSRLIIVILSTNYADSSWCLDELVHILECNKTFKTGVLPVFYNVSPTVVKHQTNSYAKAFVEHEENYKNHLEKVERWRSALIEVTNLLWWHLKDGREKEFISLIVRDVIHQMKKMNKWDKPAAYSGKIDYEFLFGIDSRVKTLFSYLETNVKNDVRFIGIWGMAGIGKTTIAKVIYDKISGQFDVCCFLANVREHSQKRGLVFLQQKLLGRLLVVENRFIPHVQYGIDLIKKNFQCKRVLLVLDDVDQLKQLESLAGEAQWFGLGSRIIITTRDEYLLTSKAVDKAYMCEGLNHDEAIQLLSLTAFKQKNPVDGYEIACSHVLEYANGNPLALKTLGKDMNDSICYLDTIKHIPQRDSFRTFCISFNSLDEEVKDIFLDIACFFNGKKVDRVLQVLDFCGFHSRIGMAVLICKSLVTISNNILQMHGLVQQMGLEIVSQQCKYDPGRRSRLWNHIDINEVLMKDWGENENIEAIVLGHTELQGNWNNKAFSRMYNLRLLIICSKVHHPQRLDCLPDNLRFLKWKGYPLDSLPSNFYPSKLVELNICHGQIELLWGEEKFLYNLKFIKLSHSQNLKKTPNFTLVPNLEKLVLEGCRNLIEVHESIESLSKLRLLNLKDCSQLERIPNFISMESLEICILSGCSRLKKLPDMVTKCSPELHFNQTTTQNLPKSTTSSITKLCLRNCDLPEGAIPSEISCLTSLEVLDVGRNKFTSLPDSISQLAKLKFLGLAHCNLLQSVPELPSGIEYVEARDCSSLVNFSNAFKVRTCTDLVLSFINCYNLKQNQVRKSLIVTLLKAYLQSLLKFQNQELSHLSGRLDIVIPGTRIPEWFKHENKGTSVRIHLPPKWSNNNWIGFVFCVVFGVNENLSDDEDGHLESKNSQEITCQLYTNEGPISTGFGFNITRGTLVESSHLWVRYISNECFGERMAKWNRTTCIDVLFGTESRCLEVKKCGFRVVYMQDVEDTSKRNLQYMFPPTEDLALGFFSFTT